jgi:pyocin large subunit-like protein
MGRKEGALTALALGLAAATLWGCDRGESAPARSHAAADGGYSDNGGDRYARRSETRDPVPLVDGAPMWSDNRRHSAQENADYHFHRDGPDFGATSLKDYVLKAHHFLEHPPKGVETIKRANGDKLLYDPKTNTFAVERRDGAPRTMFKPRDGAAYWKEQQARAASGDEGYGSRRSNGSGGDEG